MQCLKGKKWGNKNKETKLQSFLSKFQKFTILKRTWLQLSILESIELSKFYSHLPNIVLIYDFWVQDVLSTYLK